MSQEWDYPPPRKWREEVFVRPSRRDRFDKVIDHLPKPKTAWQWYVRQMQGRGHWLYKANVSALFFTGMAFVFAVVVVSGIFIGALISRAANAQELAPIEANSQVMADFPKELFPLAISLIQSHGWHCDSISAARKWIWSPGFTVVCNQYRYEYAFEDKGGNIEVSLN